MVAPTVYYIRADLTMVFYGPAVAGAVVAVAVVPDTAVAGALVAGAAVAIAAAVSPVPGAVDPVSGSMPVSGGVPEPPGAPLLGPPGVPIFRRS
jgi:hypothetical protein